MSNIMKRAVAGTLESSDVYVELEPNDSGIVIDIDSVVLNQFGEDIRRVVTEVLEAQEVENAHVSVMDRGALDCVIRARVETAIVRAKGE
ncbi:MAG: citrate lyase acyl carrier protein [Clostridiales bacterium]|nr:citrate lyase acyl carrier protein [Clostridiales bacterium]